MNKQRGTYRLILRFFIPYAVILLISLCIGFFMYDKTFNLVEQEIIDKNRTMLDQSKNVLDRRFAETESIMQQILWNPKIISFQYVKEPFKGLNTYRVIETNKSLTEYNLSNHFIFGYFVAFKNSDLVISKNKAYTMREFYNLVLQYDGTSFEQWSKDVLGSYYSKTYFPAKPATYMKNRYSIVTYIQSLGTPNYSNAAVVVLIDNREIRKMLDGFDRTDGGFAYIADQHGNVISYISGDDEPIKPIAVDGDNPWFERTIGSKEMLVTYTKSAYNGWTYVAAQPTNIVLSKVNYIKGITLTVLGVSLLVGLIVASVFAYRNSKPLQRLVRMIAQGGESEQPKKRDAYGMIEDTITELMHNNEELHVKIKEQQPYVRSAFFERLLKGGFYTRNDIDVSLQHIGIRPKSPYHAVALLHLRANDDAISKDILEELNVKRIVMNEMLRGLLPDGVYPHDVDEDKIALLYTSDAGNAERCKSQLNELLREISGKMEEQLSQQPLIGVGGIYESTFDVSRSYEEARQALHGVKRMSQSGPIYYDGLPQTAKAYYYPQDAEQRLINFVKAGNAEEAGKLLANLYEINVHERHLSLTMLRLLAFEMLGSIVKLSEQLAIQDERMKQRLEAVLKLDADKGIEQFYPLITSTYMDICSIVHERKKSHNEGLKEDVIRFIHERYMDPSFSLTTLSDQFHVSEAYFSAFFKEQTGVNFSEYLENVRMGQAKRLLTEGLAVNEIAQKVGYNSLNTFSRAFKRANGVSATVFRSSLTEGGKNA